jgi:hypothetical protein
MNAAISGDEFILPGRDRGEPLMLSQAMKNLSGVIVRAIEDLHGLFDRDSRLLLPFQMKNEF